MAFDGIPWWQLFVQFCVLSFIVFGLIGVAVGVGLIVAPPRTFRFFHAVNGWISTRSVLKSVEVPRDTDRIAHRHRHWIGAAFVVLGAIAIAGLVARVDVAALSQIVAPSGMQPVAEWIVESLRWFLIVGSAAGVVVGAMLVLSPNAEDTLERFANKWVSTRRIARSGDAMHLALDRLVEAHPAPAGWIIACAAAGVVIVGAVMLARL